VAEVEIAARVERRRKWTTAEKRVRNRVHKTCFSLVCTYGLRISEAAARGC
jgi:hypothetical protein